MFLLVPAHPGCPGQIPQSRKMVVCVCVCVCVVLPLCCRLTWVVPDKIQEGRKTVVSVCRTVVYVCGWMFVVCCKLVVS